MSNQDLSDEVIRTLRRITRAIDLQSKRLVKHYGLTGPQLLIMKKLRDFQWMTVSGLAREINVSQSTVTSILDRLEKHGYVQRSRNTADRRRVEVRLSRRGSEVLSSEPSLLHENFLARFRTLSDWEQTGLLSALQRVASMMDAPDQLDDTSVLSSLYFEEADGATLRDSSEHPENEPQ